MHQVYKINFTNTFSHTCKSHELHNLIIPLLRPPAIAFTLLPSGEDE